MDEQTLQECLLQLFENIQDAAAGDEPLEGIPPELAGVRSAVGFEAAEVLTNNAGIALAMNDGSEFQITIVQSR